MNARSGEPVGETIPRRHAGLEDESAIFDWALAWRIALFVARAPRRHKVVSSVCFLSIVLASFGVSRVFPFKYRADAVLLARPNPLTGALSTGVNRDLDAPTRFARETLLKRETLRSMVRETGLVGLYLERRPPLVRWKQEAWAAVTGSAPTGEDLVDALVDTLEDRLVVDVRDDTLSIRFLWWDPEIAYGVVKSALDTFLEKRRSTEITTIEEALSILESHRSRLERDIDQQIGKVEAQRQGERAQQQRAQPRPASVPAGPDRELARLQAALSERREAAASLAAFQQQRIAQMQAELVQQESMFARDHPALATTRREIANLSRQSPQRSAIDAEIEELERQIGRRRVDRPRAAPALEGRGEAIRELYVDDDARLNFDLRQLEILLDQHWNLMGRINSSRLEMETAQASFDQRYSVIAPPQIPTRTAKPYRTMILLGGVLVGVAFALFAATVADLRRGVVLERWQIEQLLSLPVIADVASP